MAASAHFSFFCSLLLLLAFSSSPQAQARESQFFSKTSRSDTAQEATPAKEELPAVKQEEPVQYKPDSTGNGFGLYGHGPEKLPPATTSSPSSYPTYNYNSAGENFNTENIPSEFNNKEFNGVSYENKEFNTAGRYPDSNKNNANANKKPANYNAGNIPENELNGGSYYYKYDNKEANARYPRNGDQPEQLGMSDTRTLDNGRYFFDLSAEESYRKGRYDPASSGNPAAYRSFGGDESFANGGYTYGNNNNNNRGNGYEENNSMQGYYQNNEETNTQQNQEEYVP